MAEISETDPLPVSWTLFYHDPNLNKWDPETYIPMYNIRCIKDFWLVFYALNNHKPSEHHSKESKEKFDKYKFEKGMYFMMKENCEPRWEHESNRQGGCWTKKVDNNKSLESFTELCVYAITDSLLSSRNDAITGVSISPKFNCNIIKIWNNDKSVNDIKLINPKIKYFDSDGVLYKEHEVGKGIEASKDPKQVSVKEESTKEAVKSEPTPSVPKREYNFTRRK